MQTDSPFSLHNKTILVTGASSGIGQQCAISMSKQGASLVLLGRNDERLKETLENTVNKEKHTTYSLDIRDTQQVSSFIEKLKSSNKVFDGIVNAAGISPTIPLRAMGSDKMQEAFDVNVIAGIQLTKTLCKPSLFNKNGGSVLFISSVMGSYGEVGKSLYGMTKGALIAGVKSLALEYAPKKIRFNCVSPAVVVSPMSMSSVYSKDKEALERVTSYHPLGLGEPEDIANSAIFLISDASRWVTGTNLVVDGGYTAK